jgi:SAM-dependent methyltransferase
MSQTDPAQPSTILPGRGGNIAVFDLPDGRRRLEARLDDPTAFLGRSSCETSYPVDLITRIMDRRGAQWTVEEIAREADPSYVARALEQVLLAYLPRAEFEGKVLMDFGSGMGASSIVLSRLFPSTRIVGVELVEDHVAVARDRAAACACKNVEFYLSPAPDKLPPDLPDVDLMTLSGVHEHMFPDERKSLYPMLWAVLKPGGVLFIDQTPERYFPIDTHSSGWPLVNYLPAPVVHFLLTRYCNRIGRRATWETMLRDGIRGGTVREIMRLIPQTGGKPLLLRPNQSGMRDRVDLWFTQKPPSAKRRLVRALYKTIRYTTGVTFLPSLSLAIRKPAA